MSATNTYTTTITDPSKELLGFVEDLRKRKDQKLKELSEKADEILKTV